MASTAPKTVKQLGQFLQEQQEPFILEIYLSERGYRKKKLDSEGSTINGCKGNSGKSLKRSGSFSLNNSRKGIPLCPKVLRAIYNKLIPIKDSPKIKNNANRGGQVNVTEVARNIQEVAEPDRFSSASSTTVFNSCSESDVEEASTQVQKDDISLRADTSQSFKLCSPGEETAADRKLGQNCMEEDGEQISPVSVLEEINSHRVSALARKDSVTTQEENSSKSSTTLAKKITEDSLLSASLWNLFIQSTKEKPSSTGAAELEELVLYKPNSQLFKSKKILQQTKQLLFDCVREALDNHGKERREQKQNPKEFMRPELLGKLMCDKIKVWGKQSGGEFNITRLLGSDFQYSAQEWTDFQSQKRDLAFEIGDSILEEISVQIVTDMVIFPIFNY